MLLFSAVRDIEDNNTAGDDDYYPLCLSLFNFDSNRIQKRLPKLVICEAINPYELSLCCKLFV